MFSSRISLRQVSFLCRGLSTSLHAGIPIIKAFDLAASKALDPRLQGVMRDVGAQLRSGEDVETALRAHTGVFPDLMLDMIGVAEQTGSLPEVLGALAEHYENNLRLRKDFYGQIAMPVIQFAAAILIVAGLIFIMGIIGLSTGSRPLDVLGLGLTGATGAITWLTFWGMVLASLYIGYKLAVSSLHGQKIIHEFLMRIPVVAGCLRSFAIARFSWALHLTQEAGMPIDESLDASFKATANGAFVARAPQVIGDVMEGEHLTEALAHSQLFPQEFIEIVHVGETSGTVPETLHRLSPQFEDQARRSLRALSTAAGWLIWTGIAAIIIFLIFRIVMSVYINPLYDALREANGV
ncbi:MAG: type II secretion system F family protein [Planctomycetaceae bacterium]|nr:type II secretion system F family protein [Planctomycetaceae bacterium]